MEIDLTTLESRHAHDLLTGSIIPRPIAWVSSMNENGDTNLAPFSFFTGVSWNPPVIAFSPVNRPDGTRKDTVINIEKIPEFVVHMVSVDLLHPMESTAKSIPYGKDEAELKDIHLVESTKIRPKRIQHAKIAFECILEKIVRISEGPEAGNLILGRVVMAHIDDDLILNDREINSKALDPLGRLSGKFYCHTRATIESEKN